MLNENEIIDSLFIPELDDNPTDEEFIRLRDHKYNVVSTFAYLIGVRKYFFDADTANFKIDIYNRLELNKNARIIRNLCAIRTSIEQNFRNISVAVKTDIRGVLSLSEYVPQESVMALSRDGIVFHQKPGAYPQSYIIEINEYISDRINNCKSVFPEWLNWNYVKELFLMPGGTTSQGTISAAKYYYDHYNDYPYHAYMNLLAPGNGNILYNDSKFVNLIYEWNHDYFGDRSKLMDVSDVIKSNIYQFLEEGEKIVVIVDCENSDVYNLISMLRALKWEDGLDKIQKIILINDVHTNSGWDYLSKYTQIPIENIETVRVKADKSLVDPSLYAKTFEEAYENEVDSFILLSSDSDYWPLIKSLKKRSKFLVMVEHDKCGPDIKEQLEANLIFYCYLDDFYSGEESAEMQNDILLHILRNKLEEKSFSVSDIFDEALLATRITMDGNHKKNFYNRYLKTLQFSIDEDGKCTFAIKSK